jgi:hypothetical protein
MTEPLEAVSVDAFLHELEGIRSAAARSILNGKYGRPPLGGVADSEPAKRPEIIFLVQLGVYPEWRETHLLARQIQRIDDYSLLRRVGQQIADEAKHAAVLCDQLRTWGADPKRFYLEPIYEWSASFDYMDKLVHPAEYFATSNFIGEGLFLPTLLAPMAKYDKETFSAYVNHILPDEPAHVRIGRDFILHYCKTAEMQNRVRRHATIVAKQYCLGYEAAIRFANQARAEDPMSVRDAPVRGWLDEVGATKGEPEGHAAMVYAELVKEFNI